MNLRALANSITQAVNPNVPATLQISTGYTTSPRGARTPSYAAPVTVQAQVQALTFRDITQIDGLNLQGTRRAIYLYGDVEGLVRVSQKGGDLITLTDGPNAGVWLVAMVLETWPDFCKVVATLQNGN